MMDIANSNIFNISDESISVAVRIRPLNDREKKQNAKPILSIDQENINKLWIDCKPESKSFIFDSIINSSVSQDELFQKIGKPQADFCLKGYNSSIFAYGQTGAGKTYTMLGKQGESRGLQPRVFEYIFSELNKFEHSRVKCSYLEIYNEQIMDLLSPSGSTLLVREDQKKGVYIEGLSEEKVSNSQQAIELLNTGAGNRHVSSTQMNFESSRSHSLFSLTIETKDKDEDGLEKIRLSKFHFVDLAGSERQNLTGAAGQTLKEASNINKSLTILGCVINSLVEQSQGKQRHIPYRDSKLTFILKDSLGGNSKTCIVAAISDASISFQETLSTLKFAQRAKMIKNKAQINEENNITDVRLLRLEIKQLKEKIEQMRQQESCIEKKLQDQKNDKESFNEDKMIELKEKLRKMNEDCISNEEEFQKNIQILKQEQQNEIQKYQNILSEMKQELSKQYTSDVQQQIIINSQQVRLKMLLERTFPNPKEQEGQNNQFLKDTKNLLDEIQEMQIEDTENKILSNPEQICLEEQDKNKSTSIFLQSLNTLISKIDNSIKSRKELSQQLQKIGFEGEWNTPEKMKVCEQSIQNLREQYNTQLMHLQERNTAQQEICLLKNQTQSVEDELNMKNRELTKMEEKYKQICLQMRQENEQKSISQAVELEGKIILLEEEKARLHRECERYIVERGTEKQQQINLRNKYELLLQQYEISEGKVLIADEEIKVLNSKIHELELRELNYQFRMKNMSNELQDFIQQNTHMLEEAEKWTLIEQTNEQLQKNLEEVQQELTKLNDQNDILSESNKYLQIQIDEKSLRNQDIEKQLKEYEHKINEISRVSNKNILEIQQECIKLNEQNNILCEQNRCLQSQIHQELQRNQNNEKQVKENEEKIEEYKIKMNDYEEKMNENILATNKNIQEMQLECTRLNDQNEILTESNRYQQVQINEKSQINQDIEQQLKEQEIKNTEITKQLIDQIEEAKQEIQFLNNQNDILQESNRSLQIQIDEKSLKNQNFELKLQEYEQKIDKVSKKLNKKIEEIQNEYEKLNEQNGILQEFNRQLQIQIDEKSQRNQDFQKLIEEYEEKYMEMSKKNISIQEQYDKLQQNYQNLKTDSQDSNELIEQNKSLFLRCDENVLEIQNLSKERDLLKQQIAKKSDQASRFQIKISELQVSQRHLQGALRDAQEKLSQAQNKIGNIKEKAKYIKKAEKMVSKIEQKCYSKEIEIHYLNAVIEEKAKTCNEICFKFNSTLDERDKLQDTIEKQISEKQTLQEINSRLCEANQSICREKVSLMDKLTKYETQYGELLQKQKGLEETFNNLVVQYQQLKSENSLLIVAASNQQSKIPNKVEMELQLKTEKIADLQQYLDKYSNQIRQLDKENSFAKNDLEQSQKQAEQYINAIKDYQYRIDELLQLIGEFEQNCGVASEIIEKHQIEKQEKNILLERLKSQIRDMDCNFYLSSKNGAAFGKKEIHLIEGKKYSKKAKKYKRKLEEMKEKNHQKMIQYEEQISKMKVNEDDSENLKKQIEDKEQMTKRYQNMNQDLESKLTIASKKIASQMEHIQYQQKCYEEDKKSSRQDYQKTIYNLERQLDEKSKIVAQKQLRMEYFENLHKQIADALDKNNSIYNNNLLAIKEKDRKLSFAFKIQQEVLHQLSVIINRKPFSKQNDDQLKMQLMKIHEFLDLRKFQPADDKENVNTLNINETQIIASNQNNLQIQKNTSQQNTQFMQYQNLNVNSTSVNKEVIEFDKSLEKMLFGDEQNKFMNISTSSEGLFSQ